MKVTVIFKRTYKYDISSIPKEVHKEINLIEQIKEAAISQFAGDCYRIDETNCREFMDVRVKFYLN